MIATGPAMTLQVRERDKVMEPHRIRAGDRHQPWIIGVPRTPADSHAGGTPRQNRPPLRSSKRLPGTSVSLPGITLSDEGGQGERARTRRSVVSSACPKRVG